MIKIDGEIIPEEAIRYELSRLVQFYAEHMSGEELKNQMEILKKKAEDQAVGAKLLIKEAERLDIKVSAADVDTKLEEMIKNMGGRKAFEELLAKQNMIEDALRLSIERGRKVDLLVEKITEGISDPTEKEMHEHFKEHMSEYRRPERAQAQHILIKPESDNAEDKATARSRLEEIRQKIKEGADFGDQASAHSDCPSGRRASGSLGWFGRGMMVRKFDDVVFSMKVGELSEIVETQFGFHLIYKTDHEDESDGSFEEAKDNVRDFLRHSKRGDAISAYVEELEKKSVIERS